MSENEALLDLLLVDIIAVVAVVGIYLLVAKLKGLFHGFKGLQTEHYVRSTLGMPRVATFVRSRATDPGGSSRQRSWPAFWLRYWSRKGLAKTLHRFGLERRLSKMLHSMTKAELDDVAFSLMFWRRPDCPNAELYVARPPHHITFQDIQSIDDEKAAEERKQRMLALKSKSDKQVIALIENNIKRRSSGSVQWLYDSLDRGWVGTLGTTKSKAIRLTEENEASDPTIMRQRESADSAERFSDENRV